MSLSKLMHKSLVHKFASAEVFVGEPNELPEGVLFPVELPPAHRTVDTECTIVPSILLLEAVRQLGIATAHHLLATPLDWAFIANTMILRWLPSPLPFPPFGPLEFDAHAKALDVTTRNGAPSGLTAEAHLSYEGKIVAYAAGKLTLIPPATYLAIRRHARVRSCSGTRTDASSLLEIER